MVVGVVGSAGAGKSHLVQTYTPDHWHIINLDQFGHRALIEKIDDIIRVFGKDILNKEGQIDRRRLAKIVFESQEKKISLERIVHPYMVAEVEKLVASSPSASWLIDAALLFYMHLDRLCDKIFFIKAPLVVRFYRLLKREKNVHRVLSLLSTQRGLFSQIAINHSDVEYVCWYIRKKSQERSIEPFIRCMRANNGIA